MNRTGLPLTWVVETAPTFASVDPVLGRMGTVWLYGPYATELEAIQVAEHLRQRGFNTMYREGTVDPPRYPEDA